MNSFDPVAIFLYPSPTLPHSLSSPASERFFLFLFYRDTNKSIYINVPLFVLTKLWQICERIYLPCCHFRSEYIYVRFIDSWNNSWYRTKLSRKWNKKQERKSTQRDSSYVHQKYKTKINKSIGCRNESIYFKFSALILIFPNGNSRRFPHISST